MSGQSRLPGGEPRKASQRNKRTCRLPTPSRSPRPRLGDRVHWHGRVGPFRREVGDGEHAEIVIESRVYRVRIAELG